MKRILTLTMVAVLLLGMFSFDVSAQENVSVYIEGKKIEFDVQPQIISGRTMVPMRKIFEQLGATVEWEQGTQTITGKKEDT
ncbi:MAG: copper amine oxidase N-terminal domain-containing protein, partial [Clostridia bacterium]|nr:copper amine oxidase N-terminal domain-containing protein [Clostridia bacterium]